MDITSFLLGLAERYPAALGEDGARLRSYLASVSAQDALDATYVLGLFEQKAGLRPLEKGTEQRVHNPRLNAVYPAERKRVAAKAITRHATVIAELIGPLTAAAVGLELARAEHAIEVDREHAIHEAARLHRESGLYFHVAATANALFHRYGVNQWHWACLREDDVAAIAAILRRTTVDALPPGAEEGGAA